MISDSADFPIRLHLHLHPRPGFPFPPLHLHLYDERGQLQQERPFAALAPESCPEFQPCRDRGSVSISEPGSGALWNVRPDSSGSTTGKICARGNARDSSGPATIVYAKIFSALPGDLTVLPSDAVSTTCIQANGDFLFSNVANSNEIPNAQHSSGGGTANWLVVWGFSGSGNSVALGVVATQFMGVTAAQTNCQGSGSGMIAFESPTIEETVIQSRCQAVSLAEQFLPETAECALLAQAVSSGSIILEKDPASSLRAPVWCAAASGRLGPWILELGRAASGFCGKLTLIGCQGISTHEHFIWLCSNWCPRRTNHFVPVEPAELRTRLPALQVQAT